MIQKQTKEKKPACVVRECIDSGLLTEATVRLPRTKRPSAQRLRHHKHIFRKRDTRASLTASKVICNLRCALLAGLPSLVYVSSLPKKEKKRHCACVVLVKQEE